MKKIKVKWINYILHTTAFIDKKKNALYTLHSIDAIVGVLVIIFAELWLAILSLPLYIVSKTVFDNNKSTKEFKIRRIITLYTALTLAVIWAIKFLIIIFLSFNTGRVAYTTNGVVAPTLRYELISAEALYAQVSPYMDVPSVYSMSHSPKSVFYILGKGVPGSDVVVSILKDGDSTTPQFYAGKVKLDGSFVITEDVNVFEIMPGVYNVSAFTYNKNTGKRSEMSPPMQFSIDKTPLEILLLVIDKILNIIAFLFVLTSFLLLMVVA